MSRPLGVQVRDRIYALPTDRKGLLLGFIAGSVAVNGVVTAEEITRYLDRIEAGSPHGPHTGDFARGLPSSIGDGEAATTPEGSNQ